MTPNFYSPNSSLDHPLMIPPPPHAGKLKAFNLALLTAVGIPCIAFLLAFRQFVG